MTEPLVPRPSQPDPTPQEVVDRIDDISRLLTRQARILDGLAEDARERAARHRAGADVALLVGVPSVLWVRRRRPAKAVEPVSAG